MMQTLQKKTQKNKKTKNIRTVEIISKGTGAKSSKETIPLSMVQS